MPRELIIIIIAASRDDALFIYERVAPSSPRWTHLFLVPTQLLVIFILPEKHATDDITSVLKNLLPSLLPNGGRAGLCG